MTSLQPQRIAIVDYGMGNLFSVMQAVRTAAQGLPVEAYFAQTAGDVASADRIILPGQGAMPDCMQALRASGMLPAILQAAAADTPLFGVCVGMQMLLEHSAEGDVPCLGLLPGTVEKFVLTALRQADCNRYKVPQMGWNRVWRSPSCAQHPMWQGIEDGAWFYFVHSYYAQPHLASDSAGYSDYGLRFSSALSRGRIFAAQFHPEKSQTQGLQLYRNFLLW